MGKGDFLFFNNKHRRHKLKKKENKFINAIILIAVLTLAGVIFLHLNIHI